VSAITIVRETFTENSTMGELYLDGAWQCFTLEPPESAIGSTGKPELVQLGTYQAALEMSPKFGTITPHLKGVPFYDDNGPHGPVELHWGDYPGNTDGCCLVGGMRAMNFVGNTRVALKMLVAKLPNQFTVTYTNSSEAE
jgi:Family of unknown function (DUF5675)